MQVLKLEDMYNQRALLFIFNSTSILTHEDIHNYNTRYSNNIVLPQFYRTKTQSTIFYKGINLWNDLPQDIKDLRFRGAFKNSLKFLFLNEYWELLVLTSIIKLIWYLANLILICCKILLLYHALRLLSKFLCLFF